MELLKRTVIQEGDILTLGVAVETYREQLTEKWVLFNQYVVEFDPGISRSKMQATTDKIYLEGEVADLEQVIKLEFTLEALADNPIVEVFHAIGVEAAEKHKHILQLKFFAEALG